ncbi:Transcription factor spt8 [Tulasnella sp. 403]|nr:Transcription factor spt8 [Tulasnella sp. 403]
MSDEEQSQNSSPYTSEVEEEELELEEYGEAEAEVEVGSEGEESEEEEDGESEDESEEEEEEEGEQEDAEGDEEDDDGGDFEAALENMEAMEEEPQEYEDTSKLEVKVETAAEKRRAQFTTRAPYPRTYTIEPICALPHPTATHCLAASACMSYLVTGSEDGFVRCYDFFAGVNGKTYLTAPQRHHCGIGEGTMKAGVLKMWWESYGGEGEVLSAVHSIVLEGDALWGLSGTAQWDLNTGQMVRVYGTGGGAQVVSVGIRPMGEGDGGSSDSSLFGDEEVSMDVVMTAQIDGQVLLWDRRVGTRTMRLEMGEKSPPWCVSVSGRV